MAGPADASVMIAKLIRDVARLFRLVVVAGPWTTITPASGFTQGGLPAAYRIVGDVVELSGGLAGTITASTVVATLPTEAQPATSVFMAVGAGIAVNARLNVSATGVMTVATASGSASSVFFDGCSFRLV